jgi:hypothetical protein
MALIQLADDVKNLREHEAGHAQLATKAACRIRCFGTQRSASSLMRLLFYSRTADDVFRR